MEKSTVSALIVVGAMMLSAGVRAWALSRARRAKEEKKADAPDAQEARADTEEGAS